MRRIMNTFPSSSFFKKSLMSIMGLISFSVGFWPISGFGHQAGEFYHQAMEAIQDKNLHQAESLLQQSITEFPSYAEAHHLLGMVQLFREHFPLIFERFPFYCRYDYHLVQQYGK